MLQRESLPQGKDLKPMIEIVRTNDLVLVGFLQSLLENANIPFFVADLAYERPRGHDRRLSRAGSWCPTIIVAQARRLIADAGLEGELRHD